MSDSTKTTTKIDVAVNDDARKWEPLTPGLLPVGATATFRRGEFGLELDPATVILPPPIPEDPISVVLKRRRVQPGLILTVTFADIETRLTAVDEDESDLLDDARQIADRLDVVLEDLS